MGNIIRKRYKYWDIDKSFLSKELNKRNIDKYNYSIIKEYIKQEALNNTFYLMYLVKKIKECENPRMSFNYRATDDDTSIYIPITLDYISEFINQKKYSSMLNKNLLQKIVNYSKPEYISKKIFSKKVIDKLTYKELISFLTQDIDIEKQEIFFGYNGQQFLEILSTYPIFLNNIESSIFNKLNLVEEEWKTIEKNYNNIKYKYEIDKYFGYELETFRSVIDEFELNPKLEKSIMEEIPFHFNKLQASYYIYKRLCQKFTYDEVYFYLMSYSKEKNKTKHMDTTYLSTLEGGEDVICSGISLIYAKFLDKLKLPFRITDYKEKNVKKLGETHMKVIFKVDDYVIHADGAHGLYKSDMSTEKITGETKNFKIVNTSKKIKNSFFKEILEVDEYLKTKVELLEYNDAKEAYKNIQSNCYENLSMDERISLLIDIIQSMDLKYFDMINFIDSIRHKIFISNDENYKVEFIINLIQEPKLNILIVYNNQEIELAPENNNYIILTPDNKKEFVNYEELKLRFKNGNYDFTTPKRNLLNLKEKSDNIDEEFYTK